MNKTQEKFPKSDVPQNENSGSLSQPQSIGQDVLSSVTYDEEKSSPVQTGADIGLFMHTFFKLLAKVF